MSEPTTISFVGTLRIKTWLEQQAKASDRSVSYILRQLLEKAAQDDKQSQLIEQMSVKSSN